VDISLGYISGGFLYSQIEQTGMASELQTVEGVSSRTDSNDGPQTVEVDGETYEYTEEEPYQDADLLEVLYWEKQMSMSEVADELGCVVSTISRWVDNLDIGARKHTWEKPPHHYFHHGYERWETKVDGVKQTVKVHRLLAVAEYGFETVCDMDVHHKNGVPWDNRPENIELKEHSEHTSIHSLERHGGDETPWRDEHKLRELYVEKEQSMASIAETWGCSKHTISRWIDKHGIEKRSHSEACQLSIIQ